MRFSELADGYVSQLENRNTREAYERAYAQLRGFMQERGLADDVRHFNGETCQQFARWLSEHGNGANSIIGKLSALSSLADYGKTVKVARGYALNENPTERFTWPKRRPVTRKFLYADELRAFAIVPCHPDEALVRELLIATALRADELCQLNVLDVYEAGDGRIVLNVMVKGRKNQAVGIPLPVDVGARLKAALLRRKASSTDPLVLNSRGDRYTRRALYALTVRLGKRAGITRMAVGPHSFRHTLNVLARSHAKLDVNQRAAILNHRDTNTLRKYDHLLPDESVEARDKLWAAVKAITDR
jgi:site-specific recombinase XerD